MSAHRLVVDATALPPGIVPTGTWKLVEHLTVAMAADPPAGWSVEVVARDVTLLGGRNVPIRNGPLAGEFVLRPNQVLRHGELSRLFSGDWRVAVNQLDALSVRFPEYYPSETAFRLMRNIQRASLRLADLVTTISEASLREILSFCPDLEPRRTFVVPCGADHPATPRMHPVAELEGVRFLAVVGSSFVHKNRPFAIEVLAALRRLGYPGRLVFAGPDPVFGNTLSNEDAVIRRHGLGSAVLRLGPVTEAVKWWLLAHADAVLYPSQMEGFGLVPFEAAAVGTPCLAGAVSSLPEVCGNEARLESTFDPSAWADTLATWLDDPAAASAQVDALLRRRSELRWEEAGARMWAAVLAAAELPKRWPHDQEGPPSVHVLDARPGLRPLPRAVHEFRRSAQYGRRKLAERLGGRPPAFGYRLRGESGGSSVPSGEGPATEPVVGGINEG